MRGRPAFSVRILMLYDCRENVISIDSSLGFGRGLDDRLCLVRLGILSGLIPRSKVSMLGEEGCGFVTC